MLHVGICTDNHKIYINSDSSTEFKRIATFEIEEAADIAHKLLKCVIQVRSQQRRELLLRDLNAVFDSYRPESFHVDDLGIVAQAVTKRLRALDADPNAEE